MMDGTLKEVRAPVPSYSELMERTDGPPGSSWGVFGDDDELGTVNFLTPAKVQRAAALVRRGDRFNLDWPLNAFDPPTSNLRKAALHTMFGRHENHRDDYLSDFYLQSTSQIDGLRHQRHPAFGFYNGRPGDRIRPGDGTLGVQHWARHGIVGRGVLIDVERTLAVRGAALDYAAGEAFTVDVLEEGAEACGVTLEDGDILLIRTGWCRYYFEELTADERRELPKHVTSPGLAQARETVEWLWDHHFSVVASDTVAVEAEPAVETSPFSYAWGRMMHQELIPLLGMCLGELWRLDELADDCAGDGVYEFMVVAKPLNLIGGVGSTANAIAIK